jgi:CelD/BcsL family acetyltransferase involved in cellulose biosynthesis
MLCLDAGDPRWLALVDQAPCACVFHHPAWLRVLAASYHYQPFVAAVANDDGGLSAGLPVLAVCSRLTGRRWVSLPFTDYCPPLARDSPGLGRLVDRLAARARAGDASRVEVRWPLPAHTLVSASARYVWHTLVLDADPQRVLARVHRTQRQNVRSAEREGLSVEQGTGPRQMRQFYALHSATRRRQGLPVQPWRFFELLQREVLATGLGFLLLAHSQDQCVAAGLFLCWNRKLTYKYAAACEAGHRLRANHLLIWTALRWGSEHGYSQFDFGRTDLADDGLRAFKMRWGAVEAPLVYSTLGSGVARPRAARLGRLAQAIIRRSPVWVCQAAGRVLYRHFG